VQIVWRVSHARKA